MAEKLEALKKALDTLVPLVVLATCIYVIKILSVTQVEVKNSVSPADGRAEIAVPIEPIEVEGTPVMGSPDAAVVMMEFSEFQCPYCAKFVNETLSHLVREYVDSGRVALRFRHLPLEALHRLARPAAEVAVCADRVGAFWKVHDDFFARPVFSEDEYRTRAISSGMSLRTLQDCLASSYPTERINTDLALARRLGIQGTPVFLIGRAADSSFMKVSKVLRGARPLSDFQAVLNDMLGVTGTK